ncbi:MAG: site-specific DNA-methyltransferase [Desulfamplus sp.]|nr:site-specific DNA-methyltransferase [Desulfamplus sp.]
MPTLTWTGKNKVINHHQAVPLRVLEHQYGFTAENGRQTPETHSGNMIIHGDNLEGLKALLPKYEGKIKCIYIDPPYNTGNEKWVYNDNVNDPKFKKWLGQVVGKDSEDLNRHDKWLCMMYPRLRLLHKLLADDGVIFISIDDNEINNLIYIVNDIFNEKNRLGILIWDLGTGTTAGHFTRAHEYIVTYAKDKAILNNFSNILEGEKIIHGALKKPSKANPFSKIEFPAGIEYEGINAVFEGQIGGSEKINIISEKMVFENGKLKYPVILEAGWGMRNQILSWLAGKETYDSKGQRVTKFFFNKNGILWYEKEKDIINPQTILRKFGSTKNGSTLLLEIMNEKVFDFPKPIELLSFLLKLVTDKNSIILDSFAGSGTTTHAVLNLNKQDGGNRKFILIEMEDYAENITAERVKRVINGYGTDKNFVDGLGGSFDYYELGKPLFVGENQEFLNEEVELSKIREYVFYSETKASIDSEISSYNPSDDNRYYLGQYNGTAYYFIYERDQTTTLNYNILPIIKDKAEQYIIYADNCLLSDDFMKKYNITFKKIPRDITRL